MLVNPLRGRVLLADPLSHDLGAHRTEFTLTHKSAVSVTGLAEAKRLPPQRDPGRDVVGLDFDADERACLRVTATAAQTDGLVGPADRAAAASEMILFLVGFITEVVGLS